MQEEMGSLIKALAKARKEFSQIEKGRTASIKMKSGGQFSYRYADLGDIIQATAKPLADNGLILVQRITENDGKRMLSTVLYHESGAFLPESTYQLSGRGDIKEAGGEITYIRRYAMCAYLNIAAEEDLDGRASNESDTFQTQQSPRKTLQKNKTEPSTITDGQLKRYHAIANQHGWSVDAQKAMLGHFEITSRAKIPADKYEEIIATLESSGLADQWAEYASRQTKAE
jgi:hypothetical protein